jgi:hypothetical protein
MRRSVIGTEAVTGIVRVIGDTDIIAPITDPTMATTVIADPTTVMAMAIGPTGVQVSACGLGSRLRNGHLNRRLIKTSGAAVRFSLSSRRDYVVRNPAEAADVTLRQSTRGDQGARGNGSANFGSHSASSPSVVSPVAAE